MSVEKDLIGYFKSLGLEVHTSTKARGHQGFYLRNRIDISKNITPDRIIPTLLHEFAHYIHSKLEQGIAKDGGSLSVLFNDEFTDIYATELFEITKLVDKNAKFELLNSHKNIVKSKIDEYENIIKSKYPKFLRSKKFKEFDKYIKKSDARYLLKYDRVKLITGMWFGKKIKTFSIDNLEKDFAGIPAEFAAYIRLKSCQKRQSKISDKINRLKKYYMKPTELFARFAEAIYLHPGQVKNIAPNTYERFYELLESGYYMELAEVINIAANGDKYLK